MDCFNMCFKSSRVYRNLERKPSVVYNLYSQLPRIPIQKAPALPQRNITYSQYYKTKCDYYANEPSELSFDKGDILEIAVPNQRFTRLATNTKTNERGYVHINCLYLESIYELQPWYFSNITRIEAESLLENENAGTFLVRQSLTYDYNPFTLSIRCENINSKPIVKHYKIHKGSYGYYISKNASAETLETLILLYRLDENNDLRLSQRIIRPPKKPLKYEYTAY